jgi:hypothetical protein
MLPSLPPTASPTGKRGNLAMLPKERLAKSMAEG